MPDIYDTFLAALSRLAPEGTLLVALSGGADSVCLLDLCIRYASESGRAVAAAHFNHALRGEEADRDERFCRSLCESRNIPFFSEKGDVAAYAKAHRLGTEEAARALRYAFLRRVCPKDGFILTAHHQNDRCETMLLHLARGTGLRGLCPIPGRTGNIVRPLLSVSREEILAYVSENKLSHVTDSTNEDIAFSRNRIRKNVLPELCRISPAAVQNMARSAELFAEDEDCLMGIARDFLGDAPFLDTEKAQNLHTAILVRAIQTVYNRCGYQKDLCSVHIRALCALVRDGKRDFSLSLPNCTALCERGRLYFTDRLPERTVFSAEITVGASVTLPCGFTVGLTDTPPADPSFTVVPLCADALADGRLTLTGRTNGDTVVFLGKTHKLKRMIADRKLSAAEKQKLFFLRKNGNILYSNLPCTADEAFKHKNRQIIYIYYKEKDTPS